MIEIAAAGIGCVMVIDGLLAMPWTGGLIGGMMALAGVALAVASLMNRLPLSTEGLKYFLLILT